MARALPVTSPRFLFGGTEVLGLGGASTAVYHLFERVRADGHDVHLVNILEEQDAAFFAYTFGDGIGNPLALPDVANCWLRGHFLSPQPALREHIDRIDPDVMVGFGYYASLLFKNAAPSRAVVLVTGSCQQAAAYVMSGRAQDAVALGRWLAGLTRAPRPVHGAERLAVEGADLVVTHSPQTRDMMQWFYPSSIGRIYPEVISFAEWIRDGAMPWRHKARPFAERDIDVLFIASHWDRPVKNYPLVEAIARELPDLSIHVVGDVRRPAAGAIQHGFLSAREPLFDLFGRARCVVCPSLIDAAPGILVEGEVLGCNVVASRNCGNWALCHDDLLADPFGLASFAACIRRGLTRKFEANLDVLLADGYRHLVGLLTAFAQPFPVLPMR